MKQRNCPFIRIASASRTRGYSALLVFLFIVACQPPTPYPQVLTVPASQIPVESATSSPTPRITLTPSPTPTVEELIFPYTIDGLRQHKFQSGKIRILSTLDKNDKYTSYLIDYPSDGLTITGVMQIPVGDGPFPVVILNHGFFARSVYHSGDGTDRAAAFLAEHGYLTIASDYRSWGDSDAGESFFYSGLVIDVVNLINAVASIAEANEERIAMWGHSMGGGVTMKVLTIDSRVKAAVLYSPVSADDLDIINRWGPGCFGDIEAGEKVVGCNSSDVILDDLPRNIQAAYLFAAKDVDTLKKISPIYHLDFVNAPIQIHYGTEDGNDITGTPPDWSRKLNDALLGAGKDVQIFAYQGERHSFIGQPWFDFMIRTLRFFDHYLK